MLGVPLVAPKPKEKGEEAVLLAPNAGVDVVAEGAAPKGEGVDVAPKPKPPVVGAAVDGAPKGELVAVEPNKEVVGAEVPKAEVVVDPVAPNGEGFVDAPKGVVVLAPKTELAVEVLGVLPNAPNAGVVVEAPNGEGVVVAVLPNNEPCGAEVDAPNAGVLNEEPPNPPVWCFFAW